MKRCGQTRCDGVRLEKPPPSPFKNPDFAWTSKWVTGLLQLKNFHSTKVMASSNEEGGAELSDFRKCGRSGSSEIPPISPRHLRILLHSLSHSFELSLYTTFF